ncbi:MAG: GNAT family N-acetyltransferase [Paraclostridium sp.]
MKEVIYRELIKDDYNQVKKLICEAFGFDEFIKDPKVLDSILTVYLQGCIFDSSFSKVAVKNNQVIGIILGKANNDKKNIRKLHNSFSYLNNIIKLALCGSENKKLIKEFSKVTSTYKDIIKGKEDSFQGCIQLFIVSKESRGLGIGKSLVASLFEYMKFMNVNSLYLYTDTRCNYGFYDSQNFNRLCEKEINFNAMDASLNVFLYSYTLN